MVKANKRGNSGSQSQAHRQHGAAHQEEELALVQWCSGPDSGHYTPNIPLKWVLDFDEETWDRSATYGVEWRKPPKPSRGWTILDAHVLEVSRNSGFLEKCMQKLQEDQEQGDISSSPSTPSDSTRTDTSLDKLSVQKLIESAVAQAIAVNNQHQHSPSASGVLRSTSAEVVDLGYNTLVSSHLHTMAMATDSPTRMTTILLEAAYPSDSHLIGKTYAGQKKTFNGKVYQKPGIKKRKRIVAIKETVFRKHPKFTCSSFGQTINNYIAKLALPSRRPPNEQELEDDTDEEGP